MEAFKKYLQEFPNYTSNTFEEVRPFLSKKIIQQGDTFLREGRIAKNIAFIEKGLFRLYYINDDGKEVTNCFCKENSITTSYQSLITQKPSEISVEAVETSSLIILSYDSLQKLFAKSLFWQQIGRLAAENEYIISQSHIRFLRDLSATDRYMHILENENDLLQRISLNILSTYLQISPATLSRIRKKISRT